MLTREQKAWIVNGFCSEFFGSCKTECPIRELCDELVCEFGRYPEAHLDRCLKIIAPNVLEEPKPVAAQSKWISVEDKLPDIAVSVIICRKHGKDAVKVEHGCTDGNGWWISYGAGWTKKVTHWMPMPEPPEVERNE